MATDERAATVMTCDDAQPLVREATRGGLDEPKRERVYAHMAACAACTKLADEERALDLLLEKKLPQYPAPLALKRRLQARLPPLPSTPSRRRRAIGRFLAPFSVGVAACAVVAIGLR